MTPHTRVAVVGAWLVTTIVGCSEGPSGGAAPGPLVDSSHQHYHLHASDIEHDHEHAEFSAGAHSHGHDHTPATAE